MGDGDGEPGLILLLQKISLQPVGTVSAKLICPLLLNDLCWMCSLKSSTVKRRPHFVSESISIGIKVMMAVWKITAIRYEI